MASRFAVTKDIFAEVKRLRSEGVRNAAIGAKFDLGETTIVKINKARTFHEYVRNQKLATIRKRERSQERAKQQARKQIRTVLLISAVLALALYLVGVL